MEYLFIFGQTLLVPEALRTRILMRPMCSMTSALQILVAHVGTQLIVQVIPMEQRGTVQNTVLPNVTVTRPPRLTLGNPLAKAGLSVTAHARTLRMKALPNQLKCTVVRTSRLDRTSRLPLVWASVLPWYSFLCYPNAYVSGC